MNEPTVQRTEIRAGNTPMALVPQTYGEIWQMSSTIVKAGMAPSSLKTVEQVTIAIMHGLEVGLTPMAALQSIAVIQGRPTIWGDGALGLVQGSGKLEWIKETYEGEGDNLTAVCEVKRVGDIQVKRATFSIADAKAAGLLNKQGPWTQYRNRMLRMRARSWALRDGFSDVLRGLGVTEEVMDIPADKVDHSVVGSEPLRADAPAAEIKMPGVVKAAQAEPNAAPEPAAEIIEHAPDVEYMDQIISIVEAPATDRRAAYFGIKTLAHGKTMLGTFDKEMADKARAAIGGGRVEIVYAVDGKNLKLLRVGPGAEQEQEQAAE